MQESGTLEQLKPGQSVCIAAGSREIANIALIVRTVCEVVREHGAEPFIIPAMGSHAGAQAEGQKKILADFGITEEYTGRAHPLEHGDGTGRRYEAARLPGADRPLCGGGGLDHSHRPHQAPHGHPRPPSRAASSR